MSRVLPKKIEKNRAKQRFLYFFPCASPLCSLFNQIEPSLRRKLPRGLSENGVSQNRMAFCPFPHSQSRYFSCFSHRFSSHFQLHITHFSHRVFTNIRRVSRQIFILLRIFYITCTIFEVIFFRSVFIFLLHNGVLLAIIKAWRLPSERQN